MGNTVIQLRNDTAANWTSNNPVLALGEMGIETDNQRIKFGDGTTAWNSLPYFGAQATLQYGIFTMSADQNSNLAVGNHIQFDTYNGNITGASISTGTGQQLGVMTLPAGTYILLGGILPRFSANTGCITMGFSGGSYTTVISNVISELFPTTYTYAYSSSPINPAIFTLSQSDTITWNIITGSSSISGITSSSNAYTYVLILKVG